MDLVSIIIPVYNVETYLEDCIQSVLNQTYRNIEILIIDDGSTDSSKEIAFKLASKDMRIRVFSQQNMGASIARNKGIEKSNGRFIMFLDSDDILENDAIKNLYSSITKEKCDIAMGDWINIDENNNLLANHDVLNKALYKEEKIYSNKEILKLSYFDPVPGNKIYKSDIIKDNDIKFANVGIGQDLNFFLKYIIYCDKVMLIDKIIFRYRIRSGSISRTYSTKILDIIKSFDDVEKHYISSGNFEEYMNEFYSWKIHHFNWQINKTRLIQNKKDRIKIICEFKDNTKKISKNNMLNSIEKNNFIKLKMKYILAKVYSANIYCKIYKIVNKN